MANQSCRTPNVYSTDRIKLVIKRKFSECVLIGLTILGFLVALIGAAFNLGVSAYKVSVNDVLTLMSGAYDNEVNTALEILDAELLEQLRAYNTVCLLVILIGLCLAILAILAYAFLSIKNGAEKAALKKVIRGADVCGVSKDVFQSVIREADRTFDDALIDNALADKESDKAQSEENLTDDAGADTGADAGADAGESTDTAEVDDEAETEDTGDEDDADGAEDQEQQEDAESAEDEADEAVDETEDSEEKANACD